MTEANTRRMIRARGVTLAEVSVSIAVAAAVVLAALGTRYLSVKQAVRGDAYNTAGRIGLLLLEGWRSSTAPNTYNPATKFAGQLTLTAASGPPAPGGLTALPSYRAVLDGRNYYVTLAYKNATTTAPAVLHVTVGFRRDYQAGSLTTADNYVRLTTYD